MGFGVQDGAGIRVGGGASRGLGGAGPPQHGSVSQLKKYCAAGRCIPATVTLNLNTPWLRIF